MSPYQSLAAKNYKYIAMQTLSWHKCHTWVIPWRRPTLQHKCVKSSNYLSGGCLYDNVRWFHAKLVDFLIRTVWQGGRTTPQRRVFAAQCCANCVVACLDILTVDVDGWRLLYRRINFKVLLQDRRWGFGCRLADSNLCITLT